MLRCILVDDEQLARERFRALLAKAEADVEIVGEAENGKQAVPMIYELKPDLVFLDIQMPGLTGFEVLDLLAAPRPYIVFVTAYDDYALKAFEVHALDYLTKPVKLERLVRTLDYLNDLHAREQHHEKIESLRESRTAEPLSRLTVHIGQRLRVVGLNEIKRIEAEDKLVYVYLADGKFRTDFTLDELEARLSPKEFVRIHRAHLVRLDAVRELVPWFNGTYCVRLDDGVQLPVARRRSATVKGLFGKG